MPASTTLIDIATYKIGDKFRILKDTNNSRFPIGADVILVGEVTSNTGLFSTGTELYLDWTEVPVADGASLVRTARWSDVEKTGDADPVWHPVIGSFLKVVSERGYHGFEVGAIVKVITVMPESGQAKATDGARSSWLQYMPVRGERNLSAAEATPEDIDAYNNPDYPDSFPRLDGALVFMKNENIVLRVADNKWRNWTSYGSNEVELMTDADVFRGMNRVMHHPGQPLPHIYSVGEVVKVMWNSYTGPNGEAGEQFYLYGTDGPFVPGMTATIQRVSGRSVRLAFPSGDTQVVTKEQISPA